MRDSMGALRLLALVGLHHGLHSDANAAAWDHIVSHVKASFKGDRKLDAIKGGRSTHAEHAASMATRVVEREESMTISAGHLRDNAPRCV